VKSLLVSNYKKSIKVKKKQASGFYAEDKGIRPHQKNPRLKRSGF
jgi:hypothetical protein